MTATLQYLESLARERSHDRRRTLLHAVTDRYLAAEARSAREIELFDEIVALVLEEVEPIARAELSERLADVIDPPRKVLMLLAEDEISVAWPILVRSTAINDSDLIRIASQWSQAHLNAIASRAKLSERVTDVLVERGDNRVVATVVENRGARFSRHGFFALADHAATDEALLRRLAARADLPGEIAERLLPYITAALHSKLEAAGADVDDNTLDELAEHSRAVLADRLRAAAGLGRSLDVLMDQIARGLTSLDEAVIALADAGAAPDVAKLLADRVDLRSDTIVRALCASAEEPAALLCRAAGLKVNGYSAIMRMRRRRRRGSHGAPAELLERYQKIPVETARRVIRLIKARETAEAFSRPH
jgi:uncharacterized protein (DUF2336 family)